MILTKAMCYAAGRDAGNRSARKAGRTAWAQADFAAACKAFDKLLPFVNCNYEPKAARYELRTRKGKAKA